MKKIFACVFMVSVVLQTIFSCSNSGQSGNAPEPTFAQTNPQEEADPVQSTKALIDLNIIHFKSLPVEPLPCVPSHQLSQSIIAGDDPLLAQPVILDSQADVSADDIHSLHASITLSHFHIVVKGDALTQDVYLILKGMQKSTGGTLNVFDQRTFILSPSGFVLERMNDGTIRNIATLTWNESSIQAAIPAREVEGILNQFMYSIQLLSQHDRTAERWITGPLNEMPVKMCGFEFGQKPYTWIEIGDSSLAPSLRWIFGRLHSPNAQEETESFVQIFYSELVDEVKSVDTLFMPKHFENNSIYAELLPSATFFMDFYFDRLMQSLDKSNALHGIFKEYFIQSFFLKHSLALSLQRFWQGLSEAENIEQEREAILGGILSHRLDAQAVSKALKRSPTWQVVADELNKDNRDVLVKLMKGWIDVDESYDAEFDPNLVKDDDYDGLPVFVENKYNTSPKMADTDQDGYSDLIEIEHGYDPNDTLAFPQGLAFDQLFNDWIHFIPSKLKRLSLRDECGEAQNLLAAGAVQKQGSLLVSGYLGGEHKKGGKWRLVVDIGDGEEIWVEFREGYFDYTIAKASTDSGALSFMAKLYSPIPFAVQSLEVFLNPSQLISRQVSRVMLMTLNQQNTLCQQSPWIETAQFE
jgi:hypothetical protein